MQRFENLQIDVDADGIALIRISVQGRTINVWTSGFCRDLEAAVDMLASRDDVCGIIVTSGKPNGFMAGGDIKDFAEIYERGLSPARAAQEYGRGSRVLRTLETCGKPVAAAINGLALGGGLELALACHYRVLTDDSTVRVGLPEVSVGLLPGGGGTQRLPRLIGIAAALPLIVDGRQLSPEDALAAGVVHRTAPTEQLISAARAWVFANPRAQAPWDVKGFRVPGDAGALAPHAAITFGMGTARVRRDTLDNLPAPLAALSAIYEGTQLPIDRALSIENKYFGKLLVSVVARNLMRTMFIHRGAARKLAGRPKAVPRRPARKLAVLGGGMMGSGIAQVAATAGMEVVLTDIDQQSAERGKARLVAAWERESAGTRPDADEIARRAARVHPSADLRQLDGCEFVIEAVFEDRATKAVLMDRVASVLGNRPEHFVWASNTSTLPIGGLAKNWPQPSQVIGLHFFSPVPRMELVEVVVGGRTSPETLARALDLVARLGKTPIIVSDSPGFYTSRIFCAYIDEGMAMLAEGVSPALIENAARQAGFAAGPLAVTDEVSLDLQRSVIEQAIADALPERFQRRHAHAVIAHMNQLGRLGRKTGGGFYTFPPEGRKHLWPGLADAYPAAPEQPPVDDVKMRLLAIQALEAARCLEEGVVRTAADADLGAVLGLGYPKWTGGTLSYVDTFGLDDFVSLCDGLARRHGERFQPTPWLRERARRGELFHASVTKRP